MSDNPEYDRTVRLAKNLAIHVLSLSENHFDDQASVDALTYSIVTFIESEQWENDQP